MTVHSAKGLEFPVVFWPEWRRKFSRNTGDNARDNELEEERRLAYVAVTRAKESIYCMPPGACSLAGPGATSPQVY